MQYWIQSVPLYKMCFVCIPECTADSFHCGNYHAGTFCDKGSLSCVWKFCTSMLILKSQFFIWDGTCVF